ncbi:DUF1800 domain-containing protein [Octadecabacter sp. R77987]|uniref:DUF1800 domain-containing protein n=1 Tax=Octadecabacter sp. R77987 TaxID=3093874 RepID=UPI00366BEF78
MLTRRAFHLSLLATAATAALAPDALRARTTTADPVETFLNRLTFGATPLERAIVAERGTSGWLEDQLNLSAYDDAFEAGLARQTLRIAYEAEDDDGEGNSWGALDEMRPLGTLAADPADLLHLIDWERGFAWEERVRPANEVIAASLTRAVHAPAQLREVMTQFWHDHFNVHAHKDEYTAIFFPSYDRMLRANALGNFRAMLGAVATSPTMLVYLNNDDSRASPANENYARELLELHTLGAANYLNEHANRWDEVEKDASGLAVGYIDEDVYEVARAFTGWTVGDGRWVADGQHAPMTGRFHYVDSWHDPYQKRVLGREMAPNRAPLADGEQVLDVLATHPATARFICEKIARRLLADDPDPALIQRLADVFVTHAQAPDQIAQVIRTLVADPAFAAPPTKLRRPFEFMAALYRASGAKIAAPEAAFHWQLQRAGWQQHTYPPPTGHPDRAHDWTSSTMILRMVETAVYAHDDWFGNATTRLSDKLPEGVATYGDLITHWDTRMFGAPQSGPAPLLAGIDVAVDEPLPMDAGSRHDLSAIVLAFAAISPAFLYR